MLKEPKGFSEIYHIVIPGWEFGGSAFSYTATNSRLQSNTTTKSTNHLTTNKGAWLLISTKFVDVGTGSAC